MFRDREDAGIQLGRELSRYTGKNVLILAIPKGGIEVGLKVAEIIDADFSVLIARKLPFPTNPESGFGAVAEDGSSYVYPSVADHISDEKRQQIAAAQKEEIERRIRVLRGGVSLPPLEGRHIVLVDDGVAMGSTMQAAIKCCRNSGAAFITVAVPVAGARAIRDLRQVADEVVVLESPPFFHAVAQVYEHWYDVSDAEARQLLQGRGS